MINNILKFSYYNFFIPFEEKNIYLIYNSLQNSLVEVTQEMGVKLSNLNSEEIHFLPQKTINILQDNGVIINENYDELSIIKSRAERRRNSFNNNHTNINIVIAPTNSCNMRCLYCFENNDAKGKKVNETELENTISQIVQNNNLKIFSVLWFGGEPLLKAHTIDHISIFVRDLCNKKGITYEASIITNGTLLTNANWDMLRRNEIYKVQVTLDGAPLVHNKKRVLSNPDGFKLIVDNLKRIPDENFKVSIRINGDKEVLESLPIFFEELYKNEIWPHKRKNIKLDWALKFYDKYGHNEEKSIYFASYEFQKSKNDFIRLQCHYLNQYYEKVNLTKKKVNIQYPKFSQYYCGGVEVPNNIVIDGCGDYYKCYNSIGRDADKLGSIGDIDLNNIDHSLSNFDRTQVADCALCKVLPICEEHCNYRFTRKNQIKLCSPWRFFMNERMKEYYLNKIEL